VVKSLDSFDFLAIPSLNENMVLDLARSEFLSRRENLLVLGNSGTGKTHIALLSAWLPASVVTVCASLQRLRWSAN
jgi:DNA replication protein DnaC